jgi:CubicO group peptidase (beta-lactamase class C family)
MRRLRSAILLLLAGAAVGADKPQLPDTPLGKRVAAMLAAFNSGESQRMLSAIEQNYSAGALKERPASDRAASYRQLYDETRGLELRRVEVSADALTLLAETRSTGEWYRIAYHAEPDKPFRLLGASFRLVLRPAEFAGKGKLTDAEIASALRQYAEKLSNMGQFGGVVVYARDSQTLLERAYPWRKSEREVVEYRMDDRFNLASINKMFVAASVAQLAGEGKLSFSDTIARYLPDYPRERGEKTTIHQLLTHTAGLEPLLDAKAFDDMRRAGIKTRAEQLRFLGGRPLVAAPGEKYSYSNAGYMLLEAIVESIADVPFHQYTRDHIFAPLGISVTPQGDFSAADLLRFSQGLIGGKLVPPAILATMMKLQVTTEDPETGYGYGMEVRNVNGTRIVGHGGGGPQTSAQVDIYPESGRIVIVLSRRSGNSAERVANRARELIAQP